MNDLFERMRLEADSAQSKASVPATNSIEEVRAVAALIVASPRLALETASVFTEQGAFWLLAVLLLVGAVYVAFRVGRMLGVRAGHAEIEAHRHETGLQTRRLEELLDVSERTRTEIQAALESSEDRASRMATLFAQRGDFFANISHEFRTPLTLVIDPLETALAGGYGPLEPTMEKRLRTALRNAQQILRLINQLLDLARIDSGSLRFRVKEQPVTPIIEKVVERFDSEAERRRVTLIFSGEPEISPLYVDAEKMERILANLISNALLATPPGGKVLVRLGRVEDQEEASNLVEISVRDTGIGIPAETQELIFDRFFQVRRPIRERKSGTGLGLAIVKEFVDLHHGTIAVESVPGFGSTFAVRFLVGREHFSDSEIAEIEEGPAPSSEGPDEMVVEPIEGAADASDLPGDGEGDQSLPLVLLVDDNPDVRELIRSHLSNKYRIAEASNGFEGLSEARSLRPDLIISDVIMPGLEGVAFFRMIKQEENLKHIPLILLTALASDESRLEGIQVGADAYITRPFRREELLASVDNLITSRKALRERYSQEVVLRPHDVVVPSSERTFIEEVYQVIDLHLEDSRFTVGQLAREVGMSETQLKRKLRELVDLAPVELVRKIRIERAAELLRRRAGNVGDVAFATGFSNLSYFAKCFRDRWGVTPSQFLADVKAQADETPA